MSPTRTAPPKATPLDDVAAAFDKRRDLAQRLADQDLYIGNVIRNARKAGHTWQKIADAGHVSDVAVLKASRRPER